MRNLVVVEDRRSFLRTVSLACGAYAGVCSQSSWAREEGANEKLNIAAIGVGNRGFDNLLAVSTENIVAICDVDERYLARAVERFPKSEKYRDYRKIFDRQDIDAVVISTPDHSHALPARLAMRAGWHVYCEKPLAHNLHEVRLLAEAAAQSNVVTQMGIQHHSSVGYQLAMQWLRDGVVGDVREVHAWSNRPNWPQGVERPQGEQPIPPSLDWDLWLGAAQLRPYHPDYHPLQWRGWWDFGTGALGDMGPHLIDPVFAALELDAPVAAWAETSGVNEETAPAWSIVHFSFAARGQRPALELTWYDGGKLPDPDVTGTRRPPSNGVMVVGTRGKMFIPELGKMPRTVPADLAPPLSRGEGPGARGQGPEHAIVSHHEQWISASKKKTSTHSSFAYSARLTEACLVGNLAIRCGQKLEWDTAALKATNFPNAEEFIRRTYRPGWEAV